MVILIRFGFLFCILLEEHSDLYRFVINILV